MSNTPAGRRTDCLVNELLAVIHEHDGEVLIATAIGALEIVKQALIEEALADDEEE
jgi:hypothetical protein